jgi:SAM-dependent methyltransferase
MKDFDQAAYWIERHERYRGNILAVGNENYDQEGNEQNRRQHDARLTNALTTIKPKTVLDVGCGYGRAAPIFLEAGCAYTGVDISPIAIDDARTRLPGIRFFVGDLNTWDTDERFDLVAALWVMIHFVDDMAWLSLVERCLSWVAPGGSFLMVNRFPRMTDRPQVHTKQREIGEYLPVLAKYGFRLDREFESQMVEPGLLSQVRRAVRQ